MECTTSGPRRHDELEARLTALAVDAGFACSDVGELCGELLRDVTCAGCGATRLRCQVRPLIQTVDGYLYVCRDCNDKERTQ